MANEQVKISVLEYPECVRMRKEMYLMNPNHCVQEIVDNAIDEHLAGYCDRIEIIFDTTKQEVTVTDNGRGIPTDPSPDPKYKGMSQMQLSLTQLHAGGKFGSAKEGSYKSITGGLNGVGASCVNAVSSDFVVNVFHNGEHYRMCCQKGKVTMPATMTGECPKKKTGTTVYFILDSEVWGDDKIDSIKLRSRVKQMAYLNPKLTIKYTEPDTKFSAEYNFPDGIRTYLSDITTAGSVICDPIILHKEENDIVLDLAFIYADNYRQTFYTFVNNVETARAGDHLTGFKTGISKAVQQYIDDNKIKGMQDISTEDTLEGITAIIAVKVKDPKFEGQGKTAIRMPELRKAVSDTTQEAFVEYLSKNPKISKIILMKLQQAAKARLAAKRAKEAVRESKNKLSSISLPGKLASCSCKDPSKIEIYLVEGDSAGGSAKQARDSKTQAILPVFGKVLNAQKTRPETVLSSLKILDMVKALGCGIDKTFDINKLRYHKIIIMADADYFRSMI